MAELISILTKSKGLKLFFSTAPFSPSHARAPRKSPRALGLSLLARGLVDRGELMGFWPSQRDLNPLSTAPPSLLLLCARQGRVHAHWDSLSWRAWTCWPWNMFTVKRSFGAGFFLKKGATFSIPWMSIWWPWFKLKFKFFAVASRRA